MNISWDLISVQKFGVSMIFYFSFKVSYAQQGKYLEKSIKTGSEEVGKCLK